MKKRKRIIFGSIILLTVIGVAVFYFSRKDWCEVQGWVGGYDKDSVTMKGVEALEFKFSSNTRIAYTYTVKHGSAELKVTRDEEGKDVIHRFVATEGTCDGIMTFDNEEPETYYVFETAMSKDSDYYTDGDIQVHRTKWKQMLLDLAWRCGVEMDYFGS